MFTLELHPDIQTINFFNLKKELLFYNTCFLTIRATVFVA